MIPFMSGFMQNDMVFAQPFIIWFYVSK